MKGKKGRAMHIMNTHCMGFIKKRANKMLLLLSLTAGQNPRHVFTPFGNELITLILPPQAYREKYGDEGR